MHVQITSSSWARFLDLVEEWRNHGDWRFEKELRAFAEREGWDWMPLDDKRRFRRWSLVLLKAGGSLAFNAHRRDQLDAEGGAALWIYKRGSGRGCPSEHDDLDGIVLPRDHPFWQRYMPPNGFDCGCSILAARSERFARRLGGDPDKPLPDWWTEGRGIEDGFEGRNMPDLLEVIELLGNGFFD